MLMAGSWLALSRRRLGRPAKLAFAGLATQFVALVGGTAVFVLLMGFATDNDVDGLLRYSPWADLVGTVIDILGIVGLLLLVMSVFVGRWRRADPVPPTSAGGDGDVEIEFGEVTR